jgi:hypothetical protein
MRHLRALLNTLEGPTARATTHAGYARPRGEQVSIWSHVGERGKDPVPGSRRTGLRLCASPLTQLCALVQM